MNDRNEFVRRASTDATLPHKSFSIQGFKRKAEAIRRQGDINTWMEFGIAGIQAKKKYRAKIDMEQHRLTQDFLTVNKISLRQDYDSLLGRCIKLPFVVPIEVYPLFKSGFKITKSLHIEPKSLRQPVGTRAVEEYQIPHVVLGQASERRSTIYLMLPGLINWDYPTERNVSPQVCNELYDNCLYPAVLAAVHGGEAGHWLPTYKAEMNRARGPTGRLQNSGKLIPAYDVERFGDELLKVVRAQQWGDQAYFFIEVRGSRGATQHEWDDRETKLDEYLQMIDQRLIDTTQFWLDIGTEIQCPGYVLWWRTDAHRSLIGTALKMSQRSVGAMMSQRNAYAIDIACHLEDVSGFRSRVPKLHRDRTGISYIQAYNTEKDAIYHVSEKGNSRVLSYDSVLLNKKFSIQKWYTQLSDIWKTSRRKIDGHARWEIRVNLAKHQARDSEDPYVAFEEEDLMEYLYAIERHDWWDFKLLRLVTACQTIRLWRDSEKGKSTPGSISLMIGLVYMINGLSSRPIELPAEKEIKTQMLKGVMKKVVEVNADGDEEELDPLNPLRILFPSSVILNSEVVVVPQLGPDFLMTEFIYARLFDGMNLLALQLAAERPTIQVSQDVAEEVGNRVRHRRSRVLKHKGPSRADENIAIPEEIQVLRADPMADPIQTTADQLSQMVTNIVARSYMDMLECSPNIKLSSSVAYCRLTEKERRAASPATFQEPNLALIWNKCIVKPGDAKTWDQSFSYLYAFHYREEPPRSKWQNFKQCPFFVTWNDLMNTLSMDSGKDLQALVREKWDKLCWVPYIRSDRIWYTGTTKSSNLPGRKDCITYPEGYEGAAPVLLLNPDWTGQDAYFDVEAIEEIVD